MHVILVVFTLRLWLCIISPYTNALSHASKENKFSNYYPNNGCDPNILKLLPTCKSLQRRNRKVYTDCWRNFISPSPHIHTPKSHWTISINKLLLNHDLIVERTFSLTSVQKTQKCEFIRPLPYIRYKLRGGRILICDVIRYTFNLQLKVLRK